MSHKKNKIYIFILMLVSWLFLFFAGKESLKKYLPASMFMSLLVYSENIFAERVKWWTITSRLFPKVNGIMPFVIGVFLSGSVWILKFTYKNIYLYLFVNILVDTFFSYPFYSLFKKLGVWKLIRLKQYQLSLLFFIKSLLMYAFQKYIGDRLYSRFFI
ncbi:hypothetical protein [Rossellomorea aquimaris]|uniref:Uncharacterized protein n=1 Tax=Rossellomorea aquimaris TaxID=189382 RepID=A0A366EWW0_9BACI|nr:hypothetical protein [Rossellomorea aquimaris]RBP05965.1 hypothetical protein DET59_10392 [Rossellomorea aquimaris]